MTAALSGSIAKRVCKDPVMVTLALVHGAVLVTWPSIPLIAIGLWWNANTVSHNFIHNPYFRDRRANALFSFGLSMILGLPQRLWRDRHLAHHAERSWRRRRSRQLTVESCGVALLWGGLAVLAPTFLVTVYLPGFLLGLVLCAIHGHYEHAGGTTTGYYGTFYNLLFFNDGYHCEHHAYPGRHWREVARERLRGARESRWPPVLRWIEELSPRRLRCRTLDALEKLVLRSEPLQRWVLRCHRHALDALLPELDDGARVGVIGGGLFPRTALLVAELRPAARLEIIERDPRHLRSARERLGAVAERCGFTAESFDVGRHRGFDVLVVPLAFDGDRARVIEESGARTVLVHDWAWHRRGSGTVISPWLLKRLTRHDRRP